MSKEEDYVVYGKHGVIFQPPLSWRQSEESRFTYWCDPDELRAWQKRVAQEEHEKRYGKPKDKKLVLIAKDWAKEPISPKTKKNSGQMIRPGLFLPSKAYLKWVGALPANSIYDRHAPTIDYPVNCQALIYRQRDTGDTDGFMNAIANTLQELRIVKNDRLIESWDGTRRLIDRENPRVEVTLTEVLA